MAKVMRELNFNCGTRWMDKQNYLRYAWCNCGEKVKWIYVKKNFFFNKKCMQVNAGDIVWVFAFWFCFDSSRKSHRTYVKCCKQKLVRQQIEIFLYKREYDRDKGRSQQAGAGVMSWLLLHYSYLTTKYTSINYVYIFI